MDLFVVVQCCLVVYGCFMFEGKFVVFVFDVNFGIKFVYVYGKWDKVKEECVFGEVGIGDDFVIWIGEGWYNEDGVVVFIGRYVDGCVGFWKIIGNNLLWCLG